MPDATEIYQQLLTHQRDTSLLGSTSSVLSWDQEVMMPPGGAAFRSRQLAQLAGLTHQMATDPRIGDWLSACESDTELIRDPACVTAVNIRGWRREYDRATKLPADLVVALSTATSRAKMQWQASRRENDFAGFAPHLDEILRLSRQTAECYGYDRVNGEPWDGLADTYEEGMTAASVSAVFTPLRQDLVQLLEKIASASQRPSGAFHDVKLSIDRQKAFVESVCDAMGFDRSRGRLDLSTHPFCSGTHFGDVRLTTRFQEAFVVDALGSTMHEAGHGLYEQSLPEAHVLTPRGEAAGLSIHESQSRLWENHVGRSRAFWGWAHGRLVEHFGPSIAGYSADDVYAACNVVSPSLIRVESDEATYNLHIMIRFELERAMLKGDLNAIDLPEAWNQKYKDYLGVEVPDDARGCLQDIHWSMGALSYFPTYTLGNLYAAQFFEAAEQQIGPLDAQFASGEFGPLLQWLQENIHAHGKTYTSDELCEKVTGKPISSTPLMRHLESKLLALYV